MCANDILLAPEYGLYHQQMSLLADFISRPLLIFLNNNTTVNRGRDFHSLYVPFSFDYADLQLGNNQR